MSRILVEGNFQGTIIPVTLGWDRPLQNCFVQFDLDDDQMDDPVFSTVTEVVLDTAMAQMSYDDVVAALRSAQVTVPAAALTELKLHSEHNVGNEIVRFDAGGERKALTT